jgi:hypothetical protein
MNYAAAALRSTLSALCGPIEGESFIICARSASMTSALWAMNHCAASKRALHSSSSASISCRAFRKLSIWFRQFRLKLFSVFSEQSLRKCKGISQGMGAFLSGAESLGQAGFIAKRSTCQGSEYRIGA